MGTHPIFESDFDCLTAYRDLTDQLVKVEMQSEVLKDTLDELNDASDIGRPHEIALETQERLLLEKEREYEHVARERELCKLKYELASIRGKLRLKQKPKSVDEPEMIKQLLDQ